MSQAVLNAAPYGSTVELGVHGTATPLVVPAGVTLANSYVKATGSVRNLITGGSGSKLLNVGVDCNNLVRGRVVDFPNASDFRVDGVDTFNEGIADVFYFERPRRGKIVNCTTRDGWNTITLRGVADRMTVRDIEIYGYRQRGIYGISDTGTRHVTIDGIEIGEVIGHAGTSKQPIGFQSANGYHRYLNISRVNVEGKFRGGRFGRDINGNTADAISVHRGQDGSIKDCYVSDTGELGINLTWNCKNMDVSGNTVLRSHLCGISCGVNSNGAAEVVNNIDVHDNTLIDNGWMIDDVRDYNRLSANLWFENAQDCSAMSNHIVQTRGNTRWGIRTNNVRRIDLYNYFRGFTPANYHEDT